MTKSERAERLAAAIMADRNRVKDNHNIVPCFSCGRGMTYQGRRGDLNGRFGSLRCQRWFDDGNPGYEQEWLRRKIDDYYGITGWKVIAGPTAIEIGSDYYKPLRDAFERRKASKGRNKVVRLRTGNKIANYTIRANGHGYWQPSAASRSLGFTSIDCGFDGDEARAKARALNDAASAARKQAVAAGNTNREAA